MIAVCIIILWELSEIVKNIADKTHIQFIKAKKASIVAFIKLFWVVSSVRLFKYVW